MIARRGADALVFVPAGEGELRPARPLSALRSADRLALVRLPAVEETKRPPRPPGPGRWIRRVPPTASVVSCAATASQAKASATAIQGT